MNVMERTETAVHLINQKQTFHFGYFMHKQFTVNKKGNIQNRFYMTYKIFCKCKVIKTLIKDLIYMLTSTM